ncbi:MAG: EamA family transporter [Planctomycetaceae bacterium]
MTAGYLLAVLASALWGLTYCLDERILQSQSIYRLYYLHTVGGVVLTAPLLWWQGESLWPWAISTPVDSQPASATVGLMLFTMLIATVAALSILKSIELLGAQRAAVFEISYPLFVVLFGALLFRHAVSPRVLIGGALIFAGALVIMKSE